MKTKINWPNGKQFAFTIFDDTDHASMKNAPKIYEFLHNLGMSTTKSVWPIEGQTPYKFEGATCEDPEYLQWIYKLKEQGFEIALHNATYQTSQREQIISGIEHFKKYFGDYPKIHVNHAECRDNIYWGDMRLSGAPRLIYNLLTHFSKSGKFLGDIESSEFFWGDICKQHIKYVRNFVYSEINTLKICPDMPYHDPKKPFVNYWFASAEGANCHKFCNTISEENQDRLEDEGGACIMYTHFGQSDFYEDDKINLNFTKLMERLSRKNGWFVPVSTLLDYIQHEKGNKIISKLELNKLEWRWLIEKILGLTPNI